MESRQNRKGLASLGNVLKYACIGTLLVGVTSCGGSSGGGGGSSSSSSSSPPDQVSKAYCAENKLLVEKLSSNAISKEVAIVAGATGATCGGLLIFAGADLGVSAGICAIVVGGASVWKMLTMDEKGTVKEVIDEHLDPRCVA